MSFAAPTVQSEQIAPAGQVKQSEPIVPAVLLEDAEQVEGAETVDRGTYDP